MVHTSVLLSCKVGIITDLILISRGEIRGLERLENLPNATYLGSEGAEIPRQVCLICAFLWLPKQMFSLSIMTCQKHLREFLRRKKKIIKLEGGKNEVTSALFSLSTKLLRKGNTKPLDTNAGHCRGSQKPSGTTFCPVQAWQSLAACKPDLPSLPPGLRPEPCN